MTSDTTPRDVTVFYDGSCPLCAAEIDLYRTQDTAGRLDLVDLCGAGVSLPKGLTQNAAMARFHVMTAHGEVLSGAAAFVAMWRSLPGWRWLARISDLPGVLWVMEKAYCGFLPLRPRISALFRRWRG